MSPTASAAPPSSPPTPKFAAAATAAVSPVYAPAFVRQPTWNPWLRFRQWYWPTDLQAAQEAQTRLLQRIPFFATGTRHDRGVAASGGSSGAERVVSRTIARVGLVPLSGKGRMINTLVVEQDGGQMQESG